MKKLVLISFALVLTGVIAFAQEEKKQCCEYNFLPEKGDFSMDLQFNPLGVNFNTFKINGVTVTGRYFFDSKNALRLSLGFNANSSKDGYNGAEPLRQDYDEDLYYNRALAIHNLNKNDFTSSSTGDFIVGVGYERHFGFAKRLDPYVGAGLGFDYHWANSKSVESDWDGWKSDTSSEFDKSWTETYVNNGNGAAFTFILGAVAGFDFYVYKGLYLGAELGLRMNAKSNLNGTQISSTTNPDVPESQRNRTVKIINKDSAFNMAFYAEPALRIGWKF